MKSVYILMYRCPGNILLSSYLIDARNHGRGRLPTGLCHYVKVPVGISIPNAEC